MLVRAYYAYHVVTMISFAKIVMVVSPYSHGSYGPIALSFSSRLKQSRLVRGICGVGNRLFMRWRYYQNDAAEVGLDCGGSSRGGEYGRGARCAGTATAGAEAGRGHCAATDPGRRDHAAGEDPAAARDRCRGERAGIYRSVPGGTRRGGLRG